MTLRHPRFDSEWMAWALSVTAEDRAREAVTDAEWPWAMLAQRLAFHHGAGYALNRLNFAVRAAA